MSAGIYKQDQGYWTRMMTALGFGTLIAVGGVSVYQYLEGWDVDNATGAVVAAAVAGVALCLLYWLVGRNPRTVDFFVATEGEMKKVNWSTKKEVYGSTWVVIAMSFTIAIALYVADIFFATIGQAIGLLPGS